MLPLCIRLGVIADIRLQFFVGERARVNQAFQFVKPAQLQKRCRHIIRAVQQAIILCSLNADFFPSAAAQQEAIHDMQSWELVCRLKFSGN